MGLNLCKRGIAARSQCWFCKYPGESVSHIFLECWWAKAFWNYLKIDHIIYQWSCADLGEWLWQCTAALSKEDLILLLYGAYSIWYCRNQLAHRTLYLNIESVALTTMFKVAMILQPSFKFVIIGDDEGFRWENSEMADINFFCDAAWIAETTKGGYGCFSLK